MRHELNPRAVRFVGTVLGCAVVLSAIMAVYTSSLHSAPSHPLTHALSK